MVDIQNCLKALLSYLALKVSIPLFTLQAEKLPKDRFETILIPSPNSTGQDRISLIATVKLIHTIILQSEIQLQVLLTLEECSTSNLP
jgi:hypothetical protein